MPITRSNRTKPTNNWIEDRELYPEDVLLCWGDWIDDLLDWSDWIDDNIIVIWASQTAFAPRGIVSSSTWVWKPDVSTTRTEKTPIITNRNPR